MNLTTDKIEKHITGIHYLAEKAIPELKHEIQHIIQIQSTDIQAVENCLDRLLDVLGVAVEKDTQRILGVTVARMPAKGRIAIVPQKVRAPCVWTRDPLNCVN